VNPTDEGEVVREENTRDDTEFDILPRFEFEEKNDLLEVEETDIVRELQGMAMKCHPAKYPGFMDFEGATETFVSESDLSHGDLAVRIDQEKAEKIRICIASKHRISTENQDMSKIKSKDIENYFYFMIHMLKIS
jgi:hypothetical protein